MWNFKYRPAGSHLCFCRFSVQSLLKSPRETKRDGSVMEWWHEAESTHHWTMGNVGCFFDAPHEVRTCHGFQLLRSWRTGINISGGFFSKWCLKQAAALSKAQINDSPKSSVVLSPSGHMTSCHAGLWFPGLPVLFLFPISDLKSEDFRFGLVSSVHRRVFTVKTWPSWSYIAAVCSWWCPAGVVPLSHVRGWCSRFLFGFACYCW